MSYSTQGLERGNHLTATLLMFMAMPVGGCGEMEK
jgi:hypothetical protein